jgi:peptide/nickel transport system permease protein
VLIERVFAWPGMGLLSVEAIGARDYPIILATTMIAAVLVVLGNLLADVTYAIVDPRVSYDAKRRA